MLNDDERGTITNAIEIIQEYRDTTFRSYQVDGKITSRSVRRDINFMDDTIDGLRDMERGRD